MEKQSALQNEITLEKTFQSQWQVLAQAFTSDADLTGELYAEIAEQYTAIERHYHTLTHVADLLRLFEEYRSLVQSLETVQFAIWYHDLVYDPLQTNNEFLSADIAGQRLHQLSVPDPIILQVKALILATRHHTLLPGKDDFDSRLFLDCDLAILGANRERYAEYMQEIRQEYIKVPLSDYSKGRKLVLERFLERENIFLTAEFQERFEEQARDNIRFELNLLGE